ncbi:MAG TPA: SUMF1/EgtB/PvdO family nonheme iron enzyme [Labilithrix sp.]|nr:SUMF1/EgtB/PvdO family nonheme iron enzyme [Labilithrix sp.]
MRPRLVPLAIMLGAALTASGCSSCKRAPDPGGGAADGSAATSGAIVIRPASAAGDSGAPRPGMAWIPPGTLRAGTPADRVPRVADEEPAGAPAEMGGFYIDVLPYPNEPGAIPTSNVNRDEAEQLCTAKGKRLCTELEWERACKGPDNASYEYGDTYRASACGTGVAPEEAAHRPAGEHALCKSGFGVADMHGGAWEWTDSPWGRGSKDRPLGVLRGGNAVAGELVGRCANAIGRPTAKRQPTMGLRCCAGTRNEATVQLTVKGIPGFASVETPEELHATWEPVLRPALGTAANHFTRAWKWSPVPNEELVMILGCNTVGPPTCALGVGRMLEGAAALVASADVGHAMALPDVARVGDARHLRIRGLDPAGTFGRDITYVYGRVQISAISRP